MNNVSKMMLEWFVCVCFCFFFFFLDHNKQNPKSVLCLFACLWLCYSSIIYHKTKKERKKRINWIALHYNYNYK